MFVFSYDTILCEIAKQNAATNRGDIIENRLNALDAEKRHYFNEMMTQAIAQNVIALGDVVLDLGANVGFHTAFFARLVGPMGKVHAFEPNPDLWPNIWSIENTKLWPFAIGDVISVENFILPLNHDQVGSIVDPRDFMGDIPMKVLSVAQVTVDSLIEITTDKVVFAKIDIERREINAMRGMRSLIMRDRPIIVYENDTPDIKEFMASVDYQAAELTQSVGVSGVTANLLAAPRSLGDGISKLLPDRETITRLLAVPQMGGN